MTGLGPSRLLEVAYIGSINRQRARMRKGRYGWGVRRCVDVSIVDNKMVMSGHDLEDYDKGHECENENELLTKVED
jgi:hypothetical protein